LETCIALKICASLVVQNASPVEPFMAQPAYDAQGRAARPAAPVPLTEAFGVVMLLLLVELHCSLLLLSPLPACL
jgi:hypothetical protein